MIGGIYEEYSFDYRFDPSAKSKDVKGLKRSLLFNGSIKLNYRSVKNATMGRSIYVSATISLVTRYHNISGKALILTERYKRFASKRVARVSLVKVACVFPKENSNKLNCSSFGITHATFTRETPAMRDKRISCTVPAGCQYH